MNECLLKYEHLCPQIMNSFNYMLLVPAWSSFISILAVVQFIWVQFFDLLSTNSLYLTHRTKTPYNLGLDGKSWPYNIYIYIYTLTDLFKKKLWKIAFDPIKTQPMNRHVSNSNILRVTDDKLTTMSVGHHQLEKGDLCIGLCSHSQIATSERRKKVSSAPSP